MALCYFSVPLSRTGLYKAKLRYNRRPNRLTFACVAVGDYLVRACGTDGRLDPSNDTIAAACGIAPSTAAAARKRLHLCGFLDWDRRVLRVPDRGNLLGYCVVQFSNAYVLALTQQSCHQPPLRRSDGDQGAGDQPGSALRAS